MPRNRDEEAPFPDIPAFIRRYYELVHDAKAGGPREASKYWEGLSVAMRRQFYTRVTYSQRNELSKFYAAKHRTPTA